LNPYLSTVATFCSTGHTSRLLRAGGQAATHEFDNLLEQGNGVPASTPATSAARPAVPARPGKRTGVLHEPFDFTAYRLPG